MAKRCFRTLQPCGMPELAASGPFARVFQFQLFGVVFPGPDHVNLEVVPAEVVQLDPDYEQLTIIERQPELAQVGGKGRVHDRAAPNPCEGRSNTAEIRERHHRQHEYRPE